MDGVFFFLLAVLPVLFVILTAAAMWLYPELHLSLRVVGVTLELHGWRPSFRREQRDRRSK